MPNPLVKLASCLWIADAKILMLGDWFVFWAWNEHSIERWKTVRVIGITAVLHTLAFSFFSHGKTGNADGIFALGMLAVLTVFEFIDKKRSIEEHNYLAMWARVTPALVVLRWVGYYLPPILLTSAVLLFAPDKPLVFADRVLSDLHMLAYWVISNSLTPPNPPKRKEKKPKKVAAIFGIFAPEPVG